MTPSDSRFDARESLTAILHLLDERNIQRQVDLPIDRAVTGFSLPKVRVANLPVSAFLDRLAEFVGHLYREGLLPSRILTQDQARSETVHLLETIYERWEGREFESAYVDCVSGGGVGLDNLFSKLTDALKSMHRNRYINWVLTSHVRSLDWRGKRDLIIACVDRFGPWLGEEFRKGPPERFVRKCDNLLLTLAHSGGTLDSYLGQF